MIYEQYLGIDPVTVMVIGYGVKYAASFVADLINKKARLEAQRKIALDEAQREKIRRQIEEIDRQIAEINAWIAQEQQKHASIRSGTSLAIAASVILGAILVFK